MSARVLLGHITWRYWKWRIRKEDSDGQYSSFNPSSRADSGIQRKRPADAKSTWKASNGSSTTGHHRSMPSSSVCRKRKERLRLRLLGRLLLRMDRVRIMWMLERDHKLRTGPVKCLASGRRIAPKRRRVCRMSLLPSYRSLLHSRNPRWRTTTQTILATASFGTNQAPRSARRERRKTTVAMATRCLSVRDRCFAWRGRDWE
jgi:hypothetical protein